MTTGWSPYSGWDSGTTGTDTRVEVPMFDFAAVLRTEVSSCPFGRWHLLEAAPVEEARRSPGGGVAQCECCGTLVYVPTDT